MKVQVGAMLERATFAFLFCCVSAEEPSTAQGNFGMVAATHKLAARAGVSILERGGNLVDAAVSVQLALAVVEPQHVSLLGGGAFLYKPQGRPAVHIDFREEAPSLYHPFTFCKNSSCLLDPDCECRHGAWSSIERCTGGHAFGVPGVPALLERLVTENLTTMPLATLAAPAISLAEEGFPMCDFLHKAIVHYAHVLRRDRAASEIFLNEDRTAPKVGVGELFVQPLLAQTLKTFFADVHGLRSFYEGVLAEELVQTARAARNPVTLKYGLIQLGDLFNYKAVRRAPVQFRYRDQDTGIVYNMTSGAMPFSGGVTLALTLAQMQRLNLRSRNTTRRLGYFLDSQNAAFADRNQYLADSDFVEVPLHGLLAEEYADKRFQDLFALSQDKALQTPVKAGSPPVESGARLPVRHESTSPDHGTSHVSLAHADGSVLAMTTTVNLLMGARVAVPGRGMLLNNEMCDFDPVGRSGSGVLTVNAPEGGKRLRRTSLGADKHSKGGKRPRSSMTPTIVQAPSGAAFHLAALGAPGGTDIIGGVGNVMLQIVKPDFRMSSLQNATNAPRVIGSNSKGIAGIVESALWDDAAAMAELHRLGYNLTHAAPPPYPLGETFSRVETVMVSFEQGGVTRFAGAADSLRFPPAAALAPWQGRTWSAPRNEDQTYYM